MRPSTRLARSCLFAATAIGLLPLGCSRPASTLPEPAPPVALTLVDEAGYRAALAKHQGKVVLVDFWATWCGPCVELFPHNVELAREYAPQGLAVITLSLDDPDSREQVQAFLHAREASATENYLSQYGAGPRSIAAFEAGPGALPYLKLFDRQGKLQKEFGAGAEPPEPSRIAEAVEQALAGP